MSRRRVSNKKKNNEFATFKNAREGFFVGRDIDGKQMRSC